MKTATSKWPSPSLAAPTRRRYNVVRTHNCSATWYFFQLWIEIQWYRLKRAGELNNGRQGRVATCILMKKVSPMNGSHGKWQVIKHLRQHGILVYHTRHCHFNAGIVCVANVWPCMDSALQSQSAAEKQFILLAREVWLAVISILHSTKDPHFNNLVLDIQLVGYPSNNNTHGLHGT